MREIDKVMAIFTEYVNNALCRSDSNQHKARRILKVELAAYGGHRFADEISLEQSHYQSGEMDTDTFGVYLKSKRDELTEFLKDKNNRHNSLT